MATTVKVLGQSAPSANTDTTLYTVPASTSTIASSVIVSNRGATSATFRVAVRVGGAPLANQHYIFYDIAIPAKDSFVATIGGTFSAGDVITVRASTADLSFNLFGEETA
ncbi:MAG: hypothetical protein IT195_13645 [Microthrixaceae bacterium]|nr:hypothetical protein [Microthrixaceae bacterium]